MRLTPSLSFLSLRYAPSRPAQQWPCPADHQRAIYRHGFKGPNGRAAIEEEPDPLVHHCWLPESSPRLWHQQPREEGRWHDVKNRRGRLPPQFLFKMICCDGGNGAHSTTYKPTALKPSVALFWEIKLFRSQRCCLHKHIVTFERP